MEPQDPASSPCTLSDVIIICLKQFYIAFKAHAALPMTLS